VCRPAKPVIDQRDIELELAGAFWHEPARLELDHDVPQLFDMEVRLPRRY
jgi:hypothetical protein